MEKILSGEDSTAQDEKQKLFSVRMENADE